MLLYLFSFDTELARHSHIVLFCHHMVPWGDWKKFIRSFRMEMAVLVQPPLERSWRSRCSKSFALPATTFRHWPSWGDPLESESTKLAGMYLHLAVLTSLLARKLCRAIQAFTMFTALSGRNSSGRLRILHCATRTPNVFSITCLALEWREL